jgi:hypothetical protein
MPQVGSVLHLCWRMLLRCRGASTSGSDMALQQHKVSSASLLLPGTIACFACLLSRQCQRMFVSVQTVMTA